jgi:hypothetical protein
MASTQDAVRTIPTSIPGAGAVKKPTHRLLKQNVVQNFQLRQRHPCYIYQTGVVIRARFPGVWARFPHVRLLMGFNRSVRRELGFPLAELVGRLGTRKSRPLRPGRIL